MYLRSYSVIQRIVASLNPSVVENLLRIYPRVFWNEFLNFFGDTWVFAIFYFECLSIAELVEPSINFSTSAYFCTMSINVNLGYLKKQIISVEHSAWRFSIIAASQWYSALDPTDSLILRLCTSYTCSLLT